MMFALFPLCLLVQYECNSDSEEFLSQYYQRLFQKMIELDLKDSRESVGRLSQEAPQIFTELKMEFLRCVFYLKSCLELTFLLAVASNWSLPMEAACRLVGLDLTASGQSVRTLRFFSVYHVCMLAVTWAGPKVLVLPHQYPVCDSMMRSLVFIPMLVVATCLFPVRLEFRTSHRCSGPVSDLVCMGQKPW